MSQQTENPKVKRQPVDYRYDALNHDFIKLLAEIANYAASKYGSAEQYTQARLEGEKSPINHIYEHLRLYQAGTPHDHFTDPIYHLAAIAYNSMMEALYLRKFGPVKSVVNLELVKHSETQSDLSTGSKIDLFNKAVYEGESKRSSGLQDKQDFNIYSYTVTTDTKGPKGETTLRFKDGILLGWE